ncbi:MAG: hypothetical protein WC609_01660 [Candidatus Paceibacterota bacterium]|jgi:hypothetical protein
MKGGEEMRQKTIKFYVGRNSEPLDHLINKECEALEAGGNEVVNIYTVAQFWEPQIGLNKRVWPLVAFIAIVYRPTRT